MSTIKNNPNLEKLKINPFEGMMELPFMLTLLIIFFILALITSGIISIVFWVLFGMVAIFEAILLHSRLASPWRRLHFPLMLRHAGVVGYLVSKKKENEKINIDVVMYEFSKIIYPDWNAEEIQKFLDVINEKMSSFHDKEKLRIFIQKELPKIDDEDRGILLDKIHEIFKTKKAGWIIAEVVEREHGADERVKYLYSVIAGKAH